MTSLFRSFLLCFGFLVASWSDGGQTGSPLEQWSALSKSLLQHDGKWVAENPHWKDSNRTKARWLLYEYSRGRVPHSLRLNVKRLSSKKEGWVNLMHLEFEWDSTRTNIQLKGKDNSGNNYTGESGKITASSISYDLLDPLAISPPSYLRFNQSVADSGMTIHFFEQEGDIWLFIQQMDFKPASAVKTDQ
jgi:hypothetical protein